MKGSAVSLYVLCGEGKIEEVYINSGFFLTLTKYVVYYFILYHLSKLGYKVVFHFNNINNIILTKLSMKSSQDQKKVSFGFISLTQ